MAGPYERLVDGESADTGAKAIVPVVNSVEVGLEAVEAALPGKEAAGAAAAAQAAAVQRANHTGTQAASTISDFNTAVRTNRLDQMAAPTTAVGMGSQRITGLGAPSASTDAATKAYVDSVGGGSPAASAFVNVKDYGAVGDGMYAVIACTSGSTTVTMPYAPNIFNSSDIGKTIKLSPHNGSGATVTRTITGVASSASITVSSSMPWTTENGIATIKTTDDTAAIQAAIDASGGNIVYFPPGTYITTSELTLPSESHLMGSGRGQPWGKYRSSQAATIALERGVGSRVMRNAQLTGANADNGIQIEGLNIIGCTEPVGTRYDAVLLAGPNHLTHPSTMHGSQIRNCTISYTNGNCVKFEDAMECAVLDSHILYSGLDCIQVDYLTDTIIAGNILLTDWRLPAGTFGGSAIGGNTFTSNMVHNNVICLSQYGISVNGSYNEITSNRFNDTYVKAVNLSGSGNWVHGNHAYSQGYWSGCGATVGGGDLVYANVWNGSYYATGGA
jgi:hypothetical protein